MKKKLLKITALLLAAAMLGGVFMLGGCDDRSPETTIPPAQQEDGSPDGTPDGTSEDSPDGTPDNETPDNGTHDSGKTPAFTDPTDDKYYSSLKATSGDNLMGALHDLIVTTHKKYSTYGDCRDYAETTDPALDGGAGIVEFYTHETVTTYIGNSGGAGTWNREHVWPQSLSQGLWPDVENRDIGGGGDLHHIRPSEKEMNRIRGNDKYGEVVNGTPIYSKTAGGGNSKLGGSHAGGVFEPIDEVKGDVARIVFYVYLHYNTYANVHGTTNGTVGSEYFGTLHFTDVVSATSEQGAISLLLKWNADDPVDDIERTRNEAVYEIQKNRNPFIDYAYFANAIWQAGSKLPEETPSPSVPTGKSVTVDISSFTLSASEYNFYDWSANGVSGFAYIYSGTKDKLQFNSSKKARFVANSTALPGAIRTVTVTASGAEKDWRLLTSSSAFARAEGNPSGGTDRGTETVSEEGYTWTVSGSDAYFALVYEGSGAAYLASIVITYG